jgi:hypothetical protein
MGDNTNGYITFNVTLNILMAISAKYFIPDIFVIDNVQNLLSYSYIASTLCLVTSYAILQTNTYQINKKPDSAVFNHVLLWNIVFTGLLIFLLKYSAFFKTYANSVPWYILNLFTIVYSLIILLIMVNIMIPLIYCVKFIFYYFKHPTMLPETILFPIIGFCLLVDKPVICSCVTVFYIISIFLVLREKFPVFHFFH